MSTARTVCPFVAGEESCEVVTSLPSSECYGSFEAKGIRHLGSFREVTVASAHPETKSLLGLPPLKKHLVERDTELSTARAPSRVPTSNRVISSLIAMLQGVEVLCNLAILYLYKDDFKLDPAVLAIVMGTLKVPWTVKPVWAMMSDNLPLFGYRRKSYIFVGAFLCVCATVGMGLVGCTNIWLATGLLLLYFLGSAMCNVIGEALVVEAGRGDASEAGTAKTVSIFFAFRKLSFAVMSYLSGVLLDYMDKKYVFLLATTLPLAVFLANFFLVEPVTEVLPVREQLRRLVSVVRRPALLHSTFFIFIMMSTPSAGSIMFYFMTNELKFGPELLGRMALFQSVASLFGILTYMWFFSTVSLRKLLLASTLLVTPFCLLPVVVVQRWNVQIGIPDTAFVVTDTVLMEFVGEFQAMPILVLAARLCPPGLESTIYSFLLSAYNLGLGLGALLSAGLTAAYGISATNFTNLTSLILVCAATNLLPLCLIWLVPDRIPAIETAELIDPFALSPKAVSAADSDKDSVQASTCASSDVEKGSARNRRFRASASDSDLTDSETRGRALTPSTSQQNSVESLLAPPNQGGTGESGGFDASALLAAVESGESGETARVKSRKGV
ncbi:putative integral membrane protein [Neospora caninum Liverpool]|uniref:Integral membrane protein, putative n=1 Tax=Neospora caninum (strain Liverpool) TaxID=572307 RepID=F0VEU0_NEOCL|nr:putative integral membrane protein [Neospora caninum Liverpool]CBZ52234.1 putative integral membrane protein [Neospora caninum Liverpool]CEL66202.1 TPA: integral membrane protein, putative [Neospora caninum Liverpool]|eukprot:XP_003882266.1 putative integral membrane protein [Neospora caninum Liverpool]